MEEEWRDCINWPHHQISNLGNIRTVPYIVVRKNGIWHIKGKMIRTHINGSGYVCASGGAFIHRLVAEAFIPNPDNLPEVNHKDENKLNNCADNLEWCTKQYNMNYGDIHNKISSKLKERLSDPRNHPMYGKKRPQHVIDAIRKAHTGSNNYWYGTSGPMGGKHHSPETIEKIKQSFKNRKKDG
jgi:hypothetical protein